MLDSRDEDGFEEILHSSKLDLAPCPKNLVKDLNSNLKVACMTRMVGRKLEVGVEGNGHNDVLFQYWIGLELGQYVAGLDFSEDKVVIDEHNVFGKMAQPEIGICSRDEACLITPRPLPKPPPSQWHLKNARKALSRSSRLIQGLHFDTHLLYEATDDAKEYEEAFTTCEQRMKEIDVAMTATRLISHKLESSHLGNDGVISYWITLMSDEKIDLLAIKILNLRAHFSSLKDGAQGEMLNASLYLGLATELCKYWTCCCSNENFVNVTLFMLHAVHEHMGSLLITMPPILSKHVELEWVKMFSACMSRVEIGQMGDAIQGTVNEAADLWAIRDLVLRKVGEDNMVNVDGCNMRKEVMPLFEAIFRKYKDMVKESTFSMGSKLCSLEFICSIFTRLRASIFKQIDRDCEFVELKDMEWILASRKSPMLTFGKYATYVCLLRDNEAETTGKVTKSCRILDPKLAIQHILHCVKEWSSDSSQHVRSAWPYITMGMAPVLGNDVTIEQLLPIFISLLKDEFLDVSLNIISKLEQVNQLIGIDLLSQSLLPAVVELTEDRHWRVRLAFIEYIPLLASRGVGFFNDKLGALCMHWLQDKVYSIREAAANNLKGPAEELGPEWAMQHIVPQVLNMLTNPHCLYLMTVLQKILLLALVIVPEKAREIDEEREIVVGLEMEEFGLAKISFLALEQKGDRIEEIEKEKLYVMEPGRSRNRKWAGD
ncbi:protein phosphatase 2A subunit A2 [Perilla frutescens var. hirtella]|nr:protein phosphatase 2A subunit A2 [Perilla frutescens var. hirtella]